VGGASAVGCGVFGLGGLLVGVALVVWLGSVALDGSSGMLGGGGGDTAPTTAVPIARSGAAIAIDPPADLADGAEVRVTGSGFPSGPVSITACLTHAPGGGGDRCDDSTGTVAAAGTGGKLLATRAVPRVITVGGVAYDCAAAPGACSLRARPIGRPGDPGVTAGILFATGRSPTDAEVPPTG